MFTGTNEGKISATKVIFMAVKIIFCGSITVHTYHYTFVKPTEYRTPKNEPQC